MGKKVLLVDNNKVILRLLTHYFLQQEYQVLVAEDGLEALQVLESFQPSLMLVDVIMPKINGEKLCRIIRKMPEFNSTYIVIVSAIATEERVDFLSFGANACIAKGPFNEMQEHISTVLTYLENSEFESLSQGIFGNENLSERGITKELLDTKKHFEVTLDHMIDGFLELTFEANIIFANKAATELFGVTEEDLLSSYFPNLFPLKQKQFFEDIFSRLEDRYIEIGEKTPIVLNGRYLLIRLTPFLDQGQKFIVVLIQNITKRKRSELKLIEHNKKLNKKLQIAEDEIKTLRSILPVCSYCKNVRDDKGSWRQIEAYTNTHSEAEFNHSICPDCQKKHHLEEYESLI